MSNTKDFENAADAAFVHEEFQKFLKDLTDQGPYLPEITDRLLATYGASKQSILAAMLYGFVGGLNTAAAIFSDEEGTEENEG